MLSVDDHPLLDFAAFTTAFPAPLESTPSPDWLKALLTLEADAPLSRSEDVRKAVRDLLRHGGYRPTGRGKPASEYLVRAATEGGLGSINLAVDACNAASLHAGVPISVVDLDLAKAPFRIGIAGEEAEYVFNASGHVIKLAGLLCLHDAVGPCANGVKDCQRTKTHGGTQRTVSIVWGTQAAPGRTAETTRWYRELLDRAGATTADLT